MNQKTTDQQDFPTNKTELILLHTLEDFLSSNPKKKKKKTEEKGHFGGTHKSVFSGQNFAKFRPEKYDFDLHKGFFPGKKKTRRCQILGIFFLIAIFL
jgi:hypothetical protein